MSVSQVKKHFEEFATYLGRDTAGLERLKKLKDAVNELRTGLASAEAKAATADDLTETMSIRARAAESELSDAKNEIQRLQQNIRNLSRDLQAATAEIASQSDEFTEDEIEVASLTGNEMEIKRVLKRLRARLKYCPAHTRVISHCSEKGLVRVWDRDVIAKGWSHESMWTLGATLAALAGFYGIVVLETQNSFRKMRAGRDPDSDASAWRPLIQWFSKHNIEDDPKASAYYERFQRMESSGFQA
jgi:seryl-tRNA synthetase